MSLDYVTVDDLTNAQSQKKRLVSNKRPTPHPPPLTEV